MRNRIILKKPPRIYELLPKYKKGTPNKLKTRNKYINGLKSRICFYIQKLTINIQIMVIKCLQHFW